MKLTSRSMTKLSFFLFLSVLFSPNYLFSGISIGLNHPELEWKYRETHHFKIIYHQGIELLAEQAAQVAEEIYQPITTHLKIVPHQKIPIIISDYEDRSNGLAYPLGHYIFIWTQRFKKYTTGSMTWLRRVVAHELTHQFHFLTQRNILGTPWELFALQLTPNWFTEGVAQYEAERWDDHRDLLLRVAGDDNALLPRKNLEGFMHQDEIGGRLIYEQGHSLVRYISQKYGDDKISAILKKQCSFPVSFNWSVKRALGVSESQLIRDWEYELRRAYLIKYHHHERLRQKFAPFQTQLQAAYAIRRSPDFQYAAVVGIESYKSPETRLYLFTPAGQRIKMLDGPFIGACFSWSPDSKKLVYQKLHRAKHGALLNDLVLLDIATNEKQLLTENLRATDPCWSPDGNKIVFCQHHHTSSNLVIYDLEQKTFRTLSDFGRWTEVFSPAWQPDGSQLAFSFIDAHGQRDIAQINIDGTGFHKLTNDSTDQRSPAWSPDGTKLAYISYETGHPDLFLFDLEKQTTKQLSRVFGGLFNPTWTPDGKSISVTAFEQRDSVHIYTLPLERSVAAVDANQTGTTGISWHTELPANAAPVNIDSTNSSIFNFRDLPEKSYFSPTQIRSHLIFPNIDFDDAGLQLGIYNISADPLAKHSLIWSVTHRKRTHFFLNYINQQFLPQIQFFTSQTSFDRGRFLGESLWEKFLTYNLSLRLPINFGNNLYANHLIWVTGAAVKISNYNQPVYEQFPEWAQPFSGWLNGISTGYAYSYFRPSLTYDIHPQPGFQWSSNFQRNDRALGSALEYNQYSATAVIRTPGVLTNNIFALKAGCFFHEGPQRLQSRYALGESMIRGLQESVEGSRMAYLNLDFRFPVIRNCGLKLWFLYLEGIYGAGFFDIGKAWGSQLVTADRFYWMENSFSSKNFTGTFGTELRLRAYLAGKISFVLRGGIAQRWDQFSKKPVIFFLLGPVF